MNKPKTIFIVLTVLIALVLTAGTVGAASPALGLAANPQNPAAPDDWETYFTFQGHLAQNNVPINGKCDFKLNLWTADIGGINIGTPDVVRPNVTLVDGNFALLLDFGVGAFDGSDRYLEFQSRCPAGSGAYNMLGRVPILPTTSAMSLVPGAQSAGSGTVFTATSSDGTGLMGIANATTGFAAGVYGTTKSTDAGSAGVHGHAGGTNLTSDREVGVFGESHDGYGVFGVAIYQAGVFGVNEFSGAGVKGMSAATTGETYGVQGISHSDSGHGGHFVNLDDSAASSQVGVWAGSYYGNPIEAHEVLTTTGESVNRVFYVDWAGNVYTDGSFNDTGADFAEMLPAVAGLEPADVLVIGLDGKLTQSTAAYQPTVVGVYSTKPGFLGGIDEEGNPADEIPLAVVGVVPVKASTENGAIQPGDMLVASDTPGHAMKADPDAPNGTVIGKALEPLDEGSGVILMLVMLQ